MEQDICLFCSEPLLNKSVIIGESIRALYFDLTSEELCESLINNDNTYMEICHVCHIKIKLATDFKQMILSRSKRNQAKAVTEITSELIAEVKVEGEVFVEPYRIQEADDSMLSSSESSFQEKILANIHESLPDECTFCQANGFTENNSDNHECPNCSRDFSSTESRETFEQSITTLPKEVPIVPEKCSLCQSQIDLQLPPEKGILYCCCPNCGLTVPNDMKNNLMFSCEFCDNFKSKKLALLRTHIIKIHVDVKVVCLCISCKFPFFSYEAMKRHENVCRKAKEKVAIKISSVSHENDKKQEVPARVAKLIDVVPESSELFQIEAALPLCLLCRVPWSQEASADLFNYLFRPCLACGRNVSKRVRMRCTVCKVKPKEQTQHHYQAYHRQIKLVLCSEDNCETKFLSKEAMLLHKSYHTLKCYCGKKLKNYKMMKMHKERCYVNTVVIHKVESKGKMLAKRLIETFTSPLPLEEPMKVQVNSEEDVDPLQIENSPLTAAHHRNQESEVFTSTPETVDSEMVENSTSKSLKTKKKLNRYKKKLKTNISKKTTLPEATAEDKLKFDNAKVTDKECNVCEASSDSERLEPTDKSITCPKCKRTVKFSKILHLKKLEKFSCSLCSFTTFASSDIRDHIFAKHSRNKVVYQCNICLKTFPSEELLKLHSRMLHSFMCLVCKNNKKFLRKEALDEHMKKHQKNSATSESNTLVGDIIEIN